MPLAALLLPALAALPQDAREPVQIGASSSWSVSLATDGDLTAAAWPVPTVLPPTGASNTAALSVSDGRGLSWSAPLTVPSAGGFPQVRVVGDLAFLLAWPSLRVYDASTGTLGPEVLIPTGSGPTYGFWYILDAERVGAEVHVHVAFFTHVEHPSGPAVDRLVLATSIDAGASFLPPLVRTLPASPPYFFQPFPLVMQAESGVVHVVWLDRRKNRTQVYYQRSSDGGLSFDFAEDRQLTDLAYAGTLYGDAHGSTLAFAVGELYTSDPHPGFEYANVSVAISTDGGNTFGPVQWLPGSDPVSYQTFAPALSVGAPGEVLLVWEVGDSPYLISSSRTLDGGMTWSPVQDIAPQPNDAPSLVRAGPGRERVVVTYRGLGGKPTARLSSDGGATFGPPVELGGTSIDQEGAPVVFNDRYQNLIAGWLDAPGNNPVFVGGFRPQTLTPSGFTAGATQVGAAFERFDDGSPLAFFLVSSAPGDLLLPFGDGRNLGLAQTPLFLASVSLAAGPFSAALDAAGSGALAPIPAVLPSPLSLYAVGVSFDPATLGFGDLSDVVRIDL